MVTEALATEATAQAGPDVVVEDTPAAVDRLVRRGLRALDDYAELDQERNACAHTLGATFHIAHGRTNAVLLPHVIRPNGTVPAKPSWRPCRSRP
jgi:hypothetical protein